MDKTSAVFGGVIGGVIVLVVFALYLAPHRSDILQQELITTNEQKLETSSETSIQKIGEISLADLFDKSDDGVVKVSVRKSTEPTSGRSLGSGFVYDVSGHMITNNHVVDGSQKITVTFLDGTSY